MTDASCGKVLTIYGHGGQDYGSAAPVHGYYPDLDVGMNMALTSGSESSSMGMKCGVGYGANGIFPTNVKAAIFNVVAEELRPEWNASFRCPVTPTTVDKSTCVDAASFGTISGGPQQCATLLPAASAQTGQSVADLCSGWLSQYTLAQMVSTWAPSQKLSYTPPPGYPLDMLAVALCNATCMDVNAGFCWMNGPQKPWC